MDPFTLLKKDHKKVADLFKQIESSQTESECELLFEELKQELLDHAELEEKYFYPVLEEKVQDIELEDHAKEEHEHVKERISEIESEEDDDRWMILLRKLKEDVQHHVKEEESEIFSEIRDILDDEALNELGEKMAAAKKKKTSRKGFLGRLVS